MSVPRCSFGSLADNHCPEDAAWKGTFDGEPTDAWCEEHKPKFVVPGTRHGLLQIGKVPFKEADRQEVNQRQQYETVFIEP